MSDPNKAYDRIQDLAVAGDIEGALEGARLLYNSLLDGGDKPDRPPLPPSLCNHRRGNDCRPSTGYPGALSGLAHLCRGINLHL